jgi:hypothetical protein
VLTVKLNGSEGSFTKLAVKLNGSAGSSFTVLTVKLNGSEDSSFTVLAVKLIVKRQFGGAAVKLSGRSG